MYGFAGNGYIWAMLLCPILKSIGHSDRCKRPPLMLVWFPENFETVSQSKTENETEHNVKEAFRCSYWRSNQYFQRSAQIVSSAELLP